MLRIVHGCVCSGKSTYVRENMGENDIVFDFDRIKNSLTYLDDHAESQYGAKQMVWEFRRTFLEKAAENKSDVCWFITVNLNDELKQAGDEFVYMDVTKEECLDRLEKDDTRPDKERFKQFIDEYFNEKESKSMTDVNKSLRAKIKEGREYRNMIMEVAEGEDAKIVRGYATTFDQPYDLYSFTGKDGKRHVVREQVSRDAFQNTDMSDVIMQYDHQGRVFARLSNGTLRLNTDEHGLEVTADLGGTTLGRQLYEEIQGGYTNKMSFGFTVADDDIVPEGSDYLRTIRSIGRLFDVSAVSIPANDATEISARSHCDGVIAEIEAERLRAEEEEQRKQAEREELLRRIQALKGETHGN